MNDTDFSNDASDKARPRQAPLARADLDGAIQSSLVARVACTMRQRLRTILPCFLALALGACATFLPPNTASNRPDGEGYAGRGELVLRVGMATGGGSPIAIPGLSAHKPERASVELRYLGLDSLGRAVFERHDSDNLAGQKAPIPPLTEAADSGSDASAAKTASKTADPPNTRQIALDLRLNRQIHIQGKIIEVVEATASGVVFRLY
jgi:hypothetical protein